MAGRLQSELKQSKPFASVEVEAYLNLVRTADELARQMAVHLKPHDLTPAQYNILRILRGAGESGLPCGEIGARMVTRDPDITRLLDRLEKRGLTTRSRSGADRRVVVVRITAGGSSLLDSIGSDSLDAFHRGQFQHLTRDQLVQLIDLLEAARSRDA
ncbi:MAG: MarR family transcriptional regulator [Planctomycetes bacterium]|nr:MarR family transcriptional regulator [Planctomycetota bacterium]